MGKKLERIAEHCESVARIAVVTKTRAYPSDDEKALPAYVLTDAEMDAFSQGVAFAMVSVEEMARGSYEPSRGPEEELSHLMTSWIGWRKEKAGKEARDED